MFAGYLGASFTKGAMTEWQIDIIKENVLFFCEGTIDYSFSHVKIKTG